jgi:hypothetical protein
MLNTVLLFTFCFDPTLSPTSKCTFEKKNIIDIFKQMVVSVKYDIQKISAV